MNKNYFYNTRLTKISEMPSKENTWRKLPILLNGRCLAGLQHLPAAAKLAMLTSQALISGVFRVRDLGPRHLAVCNSLAKIHRLGLKDQDEEWHTKGPTEHGSISLADKPSSPGMPSGLSSWWLDFNSWKIDIGGNNSVQKGQDLSQNVSLLNNPQKCGRVCKMPQHCMACLFHC